MCGIRMHRHLKKGLVRATKVAGTVMELECLWGATLAISRGMQGSTRKGGRAKQVRSPLGTGTY